MDILENLHLYAGIDNVFDRQPPALPDTRSGGASSTTGAEIFPVTGRYFYAGFRVKW